MPASQACAGAGAGSSSSGAGPGIIRKRMSITPIICDENPDRIAAYSESEGLGEVSMVVLNRIYTRTGDDGTTSLGSGARRKKYDLRVAAYGTVDEVNAAIGLGGLPTAGGKN